jgi:hypothetical protein
VAGLPFVQNCRRDNFRGGLPTSTTGCSVRVSVRALGACGGGSSPPTRTGRNNMKVLATMAFGPESNAILDLTLPNFQRYADRHGYTTLVMRGEGENSISHSWKKLDLMLGALEYADNVLFLDADVKIEDDSEDIAVFVPKDKWMGMVFENDGPNAGVIYCRRIGSGIRGRSSRFVRMGSRAVGLASNDRTQKWRHAADNSR